jgi:histidinol-phosphate aminotransferase
MPFNVSAPAQAAALAALDDEAHVRRSVELCAAGMAQLHQGFARLPVRAFPSLANFILVDLGRDAAPIYDALLRRGVIVRPLLPLGLPTHVRVSVGTPQENERFLGALAKVLG